MRHRLPCGVSAVSSANIRRSRSRPHVTEMNDRPPPMAAENHLADMASASEDRSRWPGPAAMGADWSFACQPKSSSRSWPRSGPKPRVTKRQILPTKKSAPGPNARLQPTCDGRPRIFRGSVTATPSLFFNGVLIQRATCLSLSRNAPSSRRLWRNSARHRRLPCPLSIARRP